ncbi:VOC family protein [Paenibacillus athensensis]|uniref:Glyoxalase/fosfomycin resistance/dioxygenase domain-containing protein n=1 Tax=Paenibacillus athensensis TaxID=1967502 RepID=A0A4Y8Q8V1_9BACL|nr:VOC family protein [Paenibacillus athensensis]MCD1260106.1 VOC family protein [Paenibacillus athensensis]
MSKLYPYIYCEDARKQAAFYAEALGGAIESVQTYEAFPGANNPNGVLHLVLQAAGQTFYMADAETVRRGNGMDLVLEFATEEEAAQAFGRLSEGGSVIMKFERMFWGAMFGRLIDPFGVRWQISAEPSV